MTGTAHRPMCPIGDADHCATQQFRRGVARETNACAWDTECGPECGPGHQLNLHRWDGRREPS